MQASTTTSHHRFVGTDGATFLEASEEPGSDDADILNDDGVIDSDANEYLVSFDTSTFYTTAAGAVGGPGSLMFINNPFAGYIEDDRNGEEMSSLESYDTVVPRGDWMLEALEEVDEDLYRDTSDEEVDEANNDLYEPTSDDFYRHNYENDQYLDATMKQVTITEEKDGNISKSVVQDLLADIVAEISDTGFQSSTVPYDTSFETSNANSLDPYTVKNDTSFESSNVPNDTSFESKTVPNDTSFDLSTVKNDISFDTGFESSSPRSTSSDNSDLGCQRMQLQMLETSSVSSSDNISDFGLSTDEGIAELSDEEINKQQKDDEQIFHLEDSLEKEVKAVDDVLNVGHTLENNLYAKLNLLVADIH